MKFHVAPFFCLFAVTVKHYPSLSTTCCEDKPLEPLVVTKLCPRDTCNC